MVLGEFEKRVAVIAAHAEESWLLTLNPIKVYYFTVGTIIPDLHSFDA